MKARLSITLFIILSLSNLFSDEKLEDQINKIVSECIPLIEKHFGKEYKDKSMPVLTTSKHINDLFILEFFGRDLVTKNLNMNVYENMKKKESGLRKRSQNFLSPGKFSWITRDVYLEEEYFRDMIRVYPDLVYFIIAHEYTHVIQNQYTPIFEKHHNARKSNEDYICTFLNEGHADWVCIQVLKELGKDSDPLKFRHILANTTKRPIDLDKLKELVDLEHVKKEYWFYNNSFRFFNLIKQNHKDSFAQIYLDLLNNPPKMVKNPFSLKPDELYQMIFNVGD